MLDDFLFGAASSAYQIEGGWNADGKAPSIWDEISHGNNQRFKVLNNHTGDIACDHYHVYGDDVKIMELLGLQAYRFSISWSRICTKKEACSNLKGIQFYRDLVQRLIDANIEPFVTLYHWDLPKWLDDIGGWDNPETIDYFNLYAKTMFEALPEVKYWITFNEPAVFIPNRWGLTNIPKAIKNVLLAHGKTVESFKQRKEEGKIGISLNLMPVSPATTDEKDLISVENIDKRHNGLWLEPIYHGTFPENINTLYGFKNNELSFTEEEQQTVSNPIDFLGVNYYSGLTVKYYNMPPVNTQIINNMGGQRDEMGTEIKPQGLEQLTLDLKKRYDNPMIYITENGCAYNDTFGHDRQIHDIRRIDYMRKHLFHCNQAIKKGVNLKGYFHWSLMDNFEWMYGYTKRFGLIYIFYPTQSRVCKDSYHWYHKIITEQKSREELIYPNMMINNEMMKGGKKLRK